MNELVMERVYIFICPGLKTKLRKRSRDISENFLTKQSISTRSLRVPLHK